MATNRSSAKSLEIRSKRKWKTANDLKPHCFSNQHESQCKDSTKKHVTCFSCGHQGHYSSQCCRRDPSLTAASGSSNGTGAKILVSKDQSLEAFNSYQQNVESRYLQDRMNGIITCMVCGKEGHYTCECSMKDQEDKVICTLCSKEGHCYLWCCQQNKSENRACTRCGEIGHSASNHGLNCSSCDEYHPHRECQMSKVTCFICEGQDHYLAQCPLNSVLTAVFQHRRENFRAALRLALSKVGSTLDTPAKASKESEVHDPNTAKRSAGKKPTPSVKCFSCGEEGHWAKRCPSKPQVLTPSKSNPLVTTDNTPTQVLKTICLNCREEGHYANQCPQKFQSALQLTLSEEGSTIATPANPSKELEERDPSTAKQSSAMKPTSSDICFSCGEKGHWNRSCPSEQVLTASKSRLSVIADSTPTRVLICFNCCEEGHYANRCPQKRQKHQDRRTKSSR